MVISTKMAKPQVPATFGLEYTWRLDPLMIALPWFFGQATLENMSKEQAATNGSIDLYII